MKMDAKARGDVTAQWYMRHVGRYDSDADVITDALADLIAWAVSRGMSCDEARTVAVETAKDCAK
jgi:hypothetical protein